MSPWQHAVLPPPGWSPRQVGHFPQVRLSVVVRALCGSGGEASRADHSATLPTKPLHCQELADCILRMALFLCGL